MRLYFLQNSHAGCFQAGLRCGSSLKRVASEEGENFITLWFYISTDYTVANLTLDGNRDNRVPAEVARGHNIVVTGGRDWTFFNVHSNNATTDGFYISSVDQTDAESFPRRGLFQNSSGKNNYRQGISIINGYDIRVLGGSYSETNGTAPASGIDLEPNPGTALPSVRNVYVCGVSFLGNEGHGFVMGATSGDSVSIQNVRAEHNLYADNGKSGVNMYTNPSKMESGVQNITYQYSTFVNNANQPRTPERRGVGLRVSGARVLVQNNIFAEHGSGLHRSVLDLPANAAVSNNFIRQNTFRDNSAQDWYAIYVHSLSGTGSQIVDNIFLNNDFKTTFRNAEPEGTCFANNVVNGETEAGECGEVPEVGSEF